MLRLFLSSSIRFFIVGLTPTPTTVVVPISLPIVLASINDVAFTSPPIISPFLPVALIKPLATTLECNIESDSILPPASTRLTLSINFETILPPAFITALFIPWIPLLNVILPPAITVAPSTTPCTTTSPFALTEKPASIFPFIVTSPLYSISPVELSISTSSSTLDTTTLSFSSITCPLT